MQIPVNGITLNAEVAGSGHPLLLLHGFTGSAASWASHMAQYAQLRRTIAVDIIGHGLSAAPTDPERYRMEQCVEDLVAVLDALNVDRFDLLGYSMGGRVALHVAAAVPDRVRALIMESGSPGLASAAEREARVASDNGLADGIDRDGLETFINSWEKIPLFASQANLPPEVWARQRAQRLKSDPVGLANSLRGMGTGRQAQLWDRLPDLRMPTLLLAGEIDTRYCQIAQEMAAAMPNAQVAVVPNAGHSVHLEQPAAFDAAVMAFLRAQDRPE